MHNSGKNRAKARQGLRAICMVSLLAGVVSLSACGGGDSGDDPVPPPGPPTPIKPDVNPNVDPDKPVAKFTVSGTVQGLLGNGLVLQNNAGDDLAIGSDGAFAFAQPVASGHAFNITVKAQPGSPSQTCTVNHGAGVVGNTNVNDATVTCSVNAFHVTGTVSGLSHGGLVLRDQGGNTLALEHNGSFSFPTPVASGASYEVSVLRPGIPAQSCTIGKPTGTVGDADVKLDIHCAPRVPLRALVPAFGGKILQYGIEPLTGRLDAEDTIDATNTAPTTLAIDPTGRFVYTFNDMNWAGVYSVDPTSGTLSRQAAPFFYEQIPTGIAFHPGGKFAFVASDHGKTIQTYGIDGKTGMLTALGNGMPITGASSIAIDSLGKYLYVTDSNGKKISIFAIQPMTGMLTEAGEQAFLGSIGSFVTDPAGKFGYTMTADASHVLKYAIDPDTGLLEPTSNSWLIETGAIALLMHPNGRYLYALNGDDAFLAVYEIRPDGSIAPTGSRIATGHKPASASIDPSGTFMFVTSTVDQTISTFIIDPVTGALSSPGGQPVATDVAIRGMAMTWR